MLVGDFRRASASLSLGNFICEMGTEATTGQRCGGVSVP